MELIIKPHTVNTYPLKGIFLRGSSVHDWIVALQELGLWLEQTTIYPLPGKTPNSIWGCLALVEEKMPDTGRHERCQAVHPHLLIPERSVVSPRMTAGEMDQLFTRRLVFHPETGWCELETPLQPEKLFAPPAIARLRIDKPEERVFIPQTVNSFVVRPTPPEEALRQLEEQFFPQQKPKNEAPLSRAEKLKLKLYRTLLGRNRTIGDGGESGARFAGGEGRKESKFSAFLNRMMPKSRMLDRMEQNLEDLERRNQKQVDKLLELFRKNPDEALKYAVPLDSQGTSRGTPGLLDLSPRWSGFNLFGNSGYRSGASGSSAVGGNYFETLREQYHKTAQSLIEEGDHRKAAFIYLKLLMDHHAAAKTLEDGKHYQDAAAIYLTCKEEEKAAACYEKGSMYHEAIDLYKKLQQHEKVGDLYRETGNHREADAHFQLQADKHIASGLYVKASEVYKGKMHLFQKGQETLLEGWRNGREMEQCLNLYFNEIPDKKQLLPAIGSVYREDVPEHSRTLFLMVLHKQFQQHEDLSEPIRDMAYEIISAEAVKRPQAVSELKLFNPKDLHIRKDTMRFLLKKK